MGESDWVKFLGTAGARFVMASQVRHSAGTLVRVGGRSIMLDPGPGTLVRCAASRPKIDAASLDAIILTHAHMDHSGDLNVLIDAMTEGGWKKRGTLFAPGDCLDGENRVLLHYLRNAPALVVPLEAQRDYELDGVRFATSAPHRHSVETYGIRFRRAQGDVSFVVDTQYFGGLAESYRGSHVLVVNVVLKDARTDGRVLHLSLPEAERLIREVSPRKAVLTHFGMTMVKAKPWDLAQDVSSRLGIEVIAASDGMTLELGDV